MKSAVQYLEIDDDVAGQRIDNFLRTQFKHLPKSFIYRILRKGEIRVNKKRVKAEYKLQPQDQIRIPPLELDLEPDLDKMTEAPNPKLKHVAQLAHCILAEDDHLIIINKPSGLAVHGGSGLSFGVIEALRALRPQAHYLELVHRIDRDTSGLLLIAKKRSALRYIQQQFRDKQIQKRYQALVMGHWPAELRKIDAPLLKNETNSIVRIHAEGKSSITHFSVLETFEQATLIEARPQTGRTHQIRVHCQHAGHPIAWDDRYGDPHFDADMKKIGIDRLFLHATEIEFIHPQTEQKVVYKAPLEHSLQKALHKLKKS